ncbi:MAG: hypothetical protein ACE5I1_17295, partial [bacterium]
MLKRKNVLDYEKHSDYSSRTTNYRLFVYFDASVKVVVPTFVGMTISALFLNNPVCRWETLMKN